MHILIISSAPYQHPESMLLGVFQKDQYDALSALGCKVGVLSPAGRSLRYLKNRKSHSKAPRTSAANIIKNSWFDYFPRMRYLQEKLFCWVGHIQYRQYIKTFGVPDLVHAHNALYAGKLALELKQVYGQPYVLTEHSSWIARQHYTGRVARVLKSIYQQANQCIAVSQYLSNQIKTYYCDRDIKVIPNVLDRCFASTSTIEPWTRKVRLRLLSVASLDDNKNQLLLLHVVKHLKEQSIRVTLTLVGAGPNDSLLKETASKLNITDSVIFTGRISREQVKSLMLESDIFCISSNVETFGVVAIEANALGLPVVTTQCGGPSDIIVSDINGRIVNKNNVLEFSSAITEVFSALPELDKQQLSMQTIARYSSSQIGAELVELYTTVKHDH